MAAKQKFFRFLALLVVLPGGFLFLAVLAAIMVPVIFIAILCDMAKLVLLRTHAFLTSFRKDGRASAPENIPVHPAPSRGALLPEDSPANCGSKYGRPSHEAELSRSRARRRWLN